MRMTNQKGSPFSSIFEISKTLKSLKGISVSSFKGRVHVNLPTEDIEKVKGQITACVQTNGGEVSSKALAASLAKTYLNLNEQGKERFLTLLAENFDVEKKLLDESIKHYQQSEGEQEQINAEIALREVIVPARIKLFKLFNSLPNGFRFLIDLRADLLRIRHRSPMLKKLDFDLKQLLASLFDVNLLDLKEITWQSSASLLEKLMEYEAVHEISSFDAMKQRLNSDRRCFAFFHNKVPGEPLTFVEVALVKKMSTGIQKLLMDSRKPIEADDAETAIFYSISSTQKGLAGINFGNFLIKKVVAKLSKELPALSTYATLSPIPGLRRWLDQANKQELKPFFNVDQVKTIKKITGFSPLTRIADVLDSKWSGDDELKQLLKQPLLEICRYYLLEVKKGRKAKDPVANFHLSNGARLERINWLGDTSEKGFRESAGLMVNYLYRLDDIDSNHESYISEGVINTGRSIKRI